MQIKLSPLLRYRNIWLGVSMLWILLAHSGFQTSFLPLIYLQMWGQGGVEICLFASAIGCYYSLEKDSDILRFMKRRFLRLAPAYLCFIMLWLIWQCTTNHLPLQIILGNLLGIQHLTGLWGSFNWYISALVVYYILAPYLKALVDRMERPLGHLLVLLCLVLVSVPFWNVNAHIIIMSRLSTLYLGMLFAKHSLRQDSIRTGAFLLILLLMTAGFLALDFSYKYLTDYLWSHGLYWYPCTLITPGLCILISLAASALEKGKIGRWVNKLLGIVGSYSFELYLIHLPLYENLPALLEGRELGFHQNLLWLATLPVLALGCVLLKTAADKMMRVFKKSPV